MGQYTCDECRPPKGDGWHYREAADGSMLAEPCPSKAMTRQHESAQELAKLAHENAWAAAQQIMRDVADTMPEISANAVRDLFEQAGIPSTLRGSAFSWAQQRGAPDGSPLIEAIGMVPSTDEGTHGHRIFRYRSLRYGRRQSA